MQVYEQYVKERADDERKEKVRKQRQRKDDFRQLLIDAKLRGRYAYLNAHSHSRCTNDLNTNYLIRLRHESWPIRQLFRKTAHNGCDPAKQHVTPPCQMQHQPNMTCSVEQKPSPISLYNRFTSAGWRTISLK